MNCTRCIGLALLLFATYRPAWANNGAPRVLTEEEIRAIVDDRSRLSTVISSPKVTVHVATPKLSVIRTGVDQSQHRRWFRVRVSGEPGVPDFVVTGPMNLRAAIADKSSTVQPDVVRRGERVRMVIDRPTMRLITVATALENAKAGKQVRVRVAGSRRNVRATAVGQGLVMRQEAP